MTNLNVLQASAGLNYPISADAYTASLIKNSLDPNADFVSENQKGVDLAISDLCLTLILSAKDISDDGYAVSLQDVAQLWRVRAFFRGKWGYSDDRPSDTPTPKLKDATYKW